MHLEAPSADVLKENSGYAEANLEVQDASSGYLELMEARSVYLEVDDGKQWVSGCEASRQGVVI